MNTNYRGARYWGQIIAGLVVGLYLCIIWAILEAIQYLIRRFSA